MRATNPLGVLASALLMIGGTTVAAVAQSATPPILRLGDARAERAGRAVLAYGIGGLAGTHLQIRVSVPGATDSTEVAMFTPRGEPMLSARGLERITLEVWLPLDDLFVLTVTRADSTKLLGIEVGGRPPTMAEAYFHRSIGYSRLKKTDGSPSSHRCWIEPGRVYRYPDAGRNWTVVYTLMPDGSRLADWFNPVTGAKTSSRRDRLRVFQGRPFWETLQTQNGRETWVANRDFSGQLPYLVGYESDMDYDYEVLGPYYGYLCDAPNAVPQAR
jgi:hypothetical protein